MSTDPSSHPRENAGRAAPRIRRALISVWDKTGIVDFARALHDEFGVEIISTGGTARALSDAGIPVTLVETLTGCGEMLGGRVKTLHPAIHAAILADRDNPEHMRQLVAAGIQPIDMVVANLYPFEQTIADPNCTFEQAIEMIDIGGVALLRAAAKNHRHVLVVCRERQFASILDSLRDGGLDPGARIAQACTAFGLTKGYDHAIRDYLIWRAQKSDGVELALEEHLAGLCLLFDRHRVLRYGENPHLTGAAYDSNPLADSPAAPQLFHHMEKPGDARIDLGGAPMSYNNYLDADAALGLCAELTRAAKDRPELWHRFPTGDVSQPDLWHRFPTGDVSQSELWHRFPTGDVSQPGLWHRFPTGDVSRVSQPASPKRARDIMTETFSRRNLPHIQVPGSTYYITFRLAGGTLNETERDIVLDACQFWHGKKATVHVASVMPDHVHLLMTPHERSPGAFYPLGEILHSIKRHSALLINRGRGATGKVWLDESFDRVVRDRAEFVKFWEYIEANPVTAGLAAPGEYRWFFRSDFGFQERALSTIQAKQVEKPAIPHRLETGATTSEKPAVQQGLETGATKAGAAAIPACVFIKHTNACGVGVCADPFEAYRGAYLGDPNAAMGGILAVNFPIDSAFAALVLETYDRFGKPLKEAGAAYAPGGFFVEVWIAPRFSADAVAIIRGTYDASKAAPEEGEPRIEAPPKKKWGENVRLLAVDDLSAPPDPKELQYRSIAGGLLLQSPDRLGLNESDWTVATKRAPSPEELDNLRLAWLICKHTKSNAITLVQDGRLIGNGAGQMSRVMSCRVATWLARENGHLAGNENLENQPPTGPVGETNLGDRPETGPPSPERDRSGIGPPGSIRISGPVAASDAFFPFPDGPRLLIDAGVTAIIQPGGSKRDQETIDLCDEHGVAMIFTGTRHFRH